MKRLVKYFLNGLLVIVPIAVTIYVFIQVFIKIDNLIPVPIRGLGFLITILITIAIGFLASNIFTGRLIKLIDRLFEKVPFVKLLYSSVKDLLEAFVGDKKSFDKPVYVQLNDTSGILGFMTNEDLSVFDLSDKVAVYLPQSYNFAGNLILVSRDKVKLINSPGSKVIEFLLSGGAGKI